MVKCGNLEISNQAMKDILAENGMDVFEMLLEVAGSNLFFESWAQTTCLMCFGSPDILS